MSSRLSTCLHYVKLYYHKISHAMLRQLRSLRYRYQQWNRWQRFFVGLSFIVIILLISSTWCIHRHHKPTAQFISLKGRAQAISTHTPIKTVSIPSASESPIAPITNQQRQQQITQWSHTWQTVNHALQQQLTGLQKAIATLTQQVEAMQTAQQRQYHDQNLTLAQLPQLKILLQQFAQQQTTVQWLKANQLTYYFHLVAVQGFSDGLRAVLDIGGHQTTVAIHESCAACHGWQLQKLDFTHQRALFTKNQHQKKVCVWLTVNGGE
ncbi:MAG: hypothetical protein GY821_13270 [Gammaproteobacteria bacterium]|nr:hypothetical protein [Gammaproteobacteria bacterium]